MEKKCLRRNKQTHNSVRSFSKVLKARGSLKVPLFSSYLLKSRDFQKAHVPSQTAARPLVNVGAVERTHSAPSLIRLWTKEPNDLSKRFGQLIKRLKIVSLRFVTYYKLLIKCGKHFSVWYLAFYFNRYQLPVIAHCYRKIYISNTT